jgi:hypothetical protein
VNCIETPAFCRGKEIAGDWNDTKIGLQFNHVREEYAGMHRRDVTQQVIREERA